MFIFSDPREPQADTDNDATDGGWDPYVASLMSGGVPTAVPAGDAEDDGIPVMSLTAGVGRRRG